ncbi:MAG: HEAT repeat domain-containing protein [Roseiflexaceae bacterium]
MFDHETWRHTIAERLSGFTRQPRQEIQLAGAPSLLGFLLTRTLDPFLEAFQREPIAAVLALAEITRSEGANQIVLRAARLRYQSAAQVDRELRASKDLRLAAEQLLVELQTIPLARQRLNSSREAWMRSTLEHELDAYPGEFSQLRRVLRDPGWQTRYEALRALRDRKGHYTPADLVLVHDGLNDSAAHVRAAAARALGMIAISPPALLIKALLRIALHDCDAETRVAAARSVGLLRDHIASPQVLDHLAASLSDNDRFVRSAAAIVLGQLGELAGSQTLVQLLTGLLRDPDAYAREAAARALGKIGVAAALPEVLNALTQAAADSDMHVHEAATDSLMRLRDLRPPLQNVIAIA